MNSRWLRVKCENETIKNLKENVSDLRVEKDITKKRNISTEEIKKGKIHRLNGIKCKAGFGQNIKQN